MFKKTKQFWFVNNQGDRFISKQEHFYLLQYIHILNFNRAYLKPMQIIDLQQYKIHNKSGTIFEILRARPEDQVFKFIIHNN